MDNDNNLQKLYKERYKKYLEPKYFENKNFVDAVKPIFKKTFTSFGKSAIAFKLTYDIICTTKNNKKIYNNYSKKEKNTIDGLLKICKTGTKHINKTLDDLINVFEI